MRASNIARRLERLETQKGGGRVGSEVIVYQVDELGELDVACKRAIARGTRTLILIPDNGRSRHDPQDVQ